MNLWTLVKDMQQLCGNEGSSVLPQEVSLHLFSGGDGVQFISTQFSVSRCCRSGAVKWRHHVASSELHFTPTVLLSIVLQTKVTEM